MLETNKYLITGASGFIGSRLIAFLRKNEFEYITLSRNCQSEKTIQCDLLRETVSNDAFTDINTVFHLAGFTEDIRNNNNISDHYHKLNVEATVNLANVAAKAGVQKFVFVSSVLAGGTSNSRKCVNEDDIGNLDSIYAQSKRKAELKLLEISQECNMHISIIRPALVYGPNMKGNLKLMLTGVKKGWFPPLPETGNRRSMVHVDDLVRAIFLIAKEQKANGEIFIATDGIPYSSREIYDTMCIVNGKKTPKWSVPKFLFDFFSIINSNVKFKVNKLLGDQCFSSSKLESLGFKPVKTLKDMNETDF